jgi:NADPH-dependent curcumin reductase CurA
MNRRIVLASRPDGEPRPENFRIEEAPLPVPAEGEALVRNLYLSIDPYMRGRMMAVKSYARHVELGEVMVGQTVGEVIESRANGLAPGDKVLTSLGWQLYGTAKQAELFRVDPARAPLTYYLGALGMPGMTAWFGLREIGQPGPGETVVVSAASGAVGSVVGQLAKSMGCRAVGIAGGPEKCAWVREGLGFDACVDYRAGNLYEDLRAACPDGVHVHFENVGGVVLDTVLRLMNPFSRLVLCGLVSDYNATEPYGLKNIRAVLVNRIRMQGMIVFDWADRYGEALAGLAALHDAGRLKVRESIVDGLERAPEALIGLLRGRNFGKQLVRLA